MGKVHKIKLSIPTPCSEDWNKMTTGEQSRFCNNCSKLVVDFSMFTDKELLDFFTKAKGKTCGRLDTSQVDRLIIAPQPNNTPLFRKVLLGTAFAAGVTSVTYGQNNSPHITNNSGIRNAHKKTNEENKPASDSTFKVIGKIIDSASKKSIPFVNIFIESDSIRIAITATDAYGKFEINVDTNLLGKKLTIETLLEGYQDKFSSYTFKKLSHKYIIIRMSERNEISNFIMGDIMPTPVTKADSTERGK